MKTYQHRSDIVTADMNGEMVMMDIVTGKYYNLGEIGGRIWQLLDQPLTLDALVARLTAEYAVPAEQCREDTLPFLEKMVALQLLNENEE